MKCKVLRGGSQKKIEANINEWLKNNPDAKIKFAAQAATPTNIFTTIFYEE